MLNEEVITTRRSKAWTSGTLYALLCNEFYLGVLSHQGVKAKGNQEAIISRVQYGKVQKQLEVRRRR